MTFKQFRNNKIVKFLSNRYILFTLIFAIWMIFLDENSYMLHRELNKETNKLEDINDYYIRETSKDKKIIKNLENKDSLERFAREEYKMKKKDEDIYIIEYDSTKN